MMSQVTIEKYAKKKIIPCLYRGYCQSCSEASTENKVIITGPDALHSFYVQCLYVFFFQEASKHNLDKCSGYIMIDCYRKLINKCEDSEALIMRRLFM